MPLLSSTLLVRTQSLTLVTIAYYLVTAPYQLLFSTPIWLLGESMAIRPAAFAPEHLDTPPANARANTKAFQPPALLSTSSRTTPIPGTTGTESERELFALVGLTLLVYALMQFLFAGDLALTSFASGARSSSSSRTPTQPPSSTSKSTSKANSSRLAEELHTVLTAQSRWLTLAGLHVVGSALLVFWIYAFHSHSHANAVAGEAMFPGLLRLANRVTFTAGLADMLFWGYLWTVLKEEGREVGKVLASRVGLEDEEEDD